MIKRIIKIGICFLLTAAFVMGMSLTAFAHSGRTDSRGGHNDTRNVSGLGSYHFHCGGYPAHLHISGYCPYRDVFPTQVSLSAEKTSLGIGETCSISASVSPSNACNTSVLWTSSDPDIVSIQDGKITALGFGTATISASTFNDKVGSIRITVKEKVADSIEINGTPEFTEEQSPAIDIGDTVTLSAIILPEDVDNPSITWSSSNPDVISIDNGEIKALKEGNSIITATTSNGKTDSIELSVQEVVAEKVEIQLPDVITVGDKVDLRVRFYPENSSYKGIEWKTGNKQIATVDADGKLQAKEVGVVSISAIQKD